MSLISSMAYLLHKTNKLNISERTKERERYVKWAVSIFTKLDKVNKRT